MCLLREFAFFSSVPVAMVVLLSAFCWRSRTDPVSLICRSPLAGAYITASLLYWLVSAILSSDYSSNLRFVEAGISGILVSTVAVRSRPMLAQALRGMLLVSVSVCCGMAPHLRGTMADRIGDIVINGTHIGNPVQLGVPLSLGALLLMADQETSRRLFGRIAHGATLAATFLCLLLTASRATWVVCASGMFLLAVVDRSRRTACLAGLLTVALCGVFLAIGVQNKGFLGAVARTTLRDGNYRHVTSGRTDQWLLASALLGHSDTALLLGAGPGNARKTYSRVSTSAVGPVYARGEEVMWHSLYLTIAVELGLPGLLAVMVWLLLLIRHALAMTMRIQYVLPFLAATSYALLAFSVTNANALAGVLLGIAWSSNCTKSLTHE
jgi:O-antigen ligase